MYINVLHYFVRIHVPGSSRTAHIHHLHIFLLLLLHSKVLILAIWHSLLTMNKFLTGIKISENLNFANIP